MTRARPSAGRLIAAGLTGASMLLVALAIGVLFELDREARLHGEVLGQLEFLDRMNTLRDAMVSLGHAAQIAGAAGTSESRRDVESAAMRAEATLGQLQRSMPADGPAAPSLPQSVRLAILNARSVGSVREARGPEAAAEVAEEAFRNVQRVADAIERDSDARTAALGRRVRVQMQLAERIRLYVAISIVGTLVLLGIVHALYRASRRRERAALARIAHLAHFDTVTGLPNRALLVDRLDLEVARAQRGGESFALFLFDLDGFKAVNDTWGHSAGDRALRIVGERARAVLRASDTVGRLGGDEFMALLPQTGQEGAAIVAEKLRDALSKPYDVGGAEASMSASIGIAFHPQHGTDSEVLRKAADTALYAAKREGKNQVRVALGGRQAASDPAAG